MRGNRLTNFIAGALLMSLLCNPLSAGSEKGCPVLPQPSGFKSLSGQAELSSARVLVLCPGTDGNDRLAASELNLWLTEMGLDSLRVLKYTDGMDTRGAVLIGPPQPGSPVLAALDKGESAPDRESYILEASGSNVTIIGNDPAGRFYGLMSLAQLLRDCGGRSVPACVIRDHPALGLRGVSDDISRGQISTLSDFKRFVRFMARYKMNLFMPYLEDMLQVEGLPKFGEGRGALTREEVRELVSFASGLHVRVVPAFQTLGHYENFLLDPDNFPLAEFPGAQCLCPVEEKVYPFLKQALGAVCGAFSDSLVNAGCDETWDTGRGKSRPQARREGLAAVHAAHYRRVHSLVSAYGRRMLMYGDIILNNPKILESGALPRDVVIVDWHYDNAASYPSVARFRNAGFQVLVCPGLSNWSRFYPFWGTALDNIENLTREGLRRGALGAVTSSWCDFGAPNLRQNAAWGWAFAAACAWNPDRLDRTALERLFWRQFLACDNPDALIRVNSLLSGIGRSAFDDWWRHPLAGPSPRGMIGVKKDGTAWGTELKARMNEASAVIESCRTSVRANPWFLDILDLSARMGELLGEKFIWMDRAAKAGKGKLSSEAASSLAEAARKIKERMVTLRAVYRDLWLRFNRSEGLENNLALWDRQILYWDSILESLEKERRLPGWSLPGDWTAPAASLPGKKLARQRTAYYVTDIECPASVDSAKIQLMGESHVEAWVNGRWAGRKIARWCLSEIVDRQRAMILDIDGLIKAGTNRLAISVTNFEGQVPAFNVYLEIYSGSKVTDHPFRASAWRGVEPATAPEGWSAPGFASASWPFCGAFKYENPVSRPFFANGLPSRVER
jgi:hypothetical protein